MATFESSIEDIQEMLTQNPLAASQLKSITLERQLHEAQTKLAVLENRENGTDREKQSPVKAIK